MCFSPFSELIHGKARFQLHCPFEILRHPSCVYILSENAERAKTLAGAFHAVT